MTAKRLQVIMSHIFPDAMFSSEKPLPTFDELPAYKNFPGCAWAIWGPDDQLGTVNLLTEDVVKKAAEEEIKLGKSVSLNWPINFPEKPVYNRMPPEIKMIVKVAGAGMPRDDEIHINSQSGSQWDGLRHYGIIEHGVFYNNTDAKSLPSGVIPLANPNDIDPIHTRLGIQNWANHGICGRGVLLDHVSYYTQNGGDMPYDPWNAHAISVADLEAVAKHQNIEIK